MKPSPRTAANRRSTAPPTGVAYLRHCIKSPDNYVQRGTGHALIATVLLVIGGAMFTISGFAQWPLLTWASLAALLPAFVYVALACIPYLRGPDNPPQQR